MNEELNPNEAAAESQQERDAENAIANDGEMVVRSFRELLSRSFATIEADMTTGKRKETKYVTGYNYLADFEIERLVEALRKTVANLPQ